MGSGAPPRPPAGRCVPHACGYRPGRQGRLAAAVGWLVAGPLALAAAAHLTQLDQEATVLLLVAGLTPWLWAPALLPAAVGVWTRRRVLAALAGGVLLLDLAWALAGLGLPRSAPGAGTGPGLRLFSANLYYGNPRIDAVASEVRTAAADVVALTELSQANAAGLRRSGVLRAYPYAVVRSRGGAFGIGLWSRQPLAQAQVTTVAGAPVIRATVLLGGRRLRLYVVHTVAPLGEDLDRWREQLAWLDQAVRRERGPVVVAGDLNATRWHRGLSRLLAERLDDAHERRGRGWVATWPRDRWPLPPLLRLDHVLVSRQVGVRAVWEGAGHGSDHLPVLADLVLAGAAARGPAGPGADGLPSRHGHLRPATSPALSLRSPPLRPRALPTGNRLRPLRSGRLPSLPATVALAAVDRPPPSRVRR
jgi:endonuclease/exonuclease/phosphatase (EEP) superfamily protein YafD